MRLRHLASRQNWNDPLPWGGILHVPRGEQSSPARACLELCA